MRVAKANALIRFAVTTKLIRTYVFAHAKCWYSQKAAHVFFFLLPSYEVVTHIKKYRVLNFHIYLHTVKLLHDSWLL